MLSVTVTVSVCVCEWVYVPFVSDSEGVTLSLVLVEVWILWVHPWWKKTSQTIHIYNICPVHFFYFFYCSWSDRHKIHSWYMDLGKTAGWTLNMTYSHPTDKNFCAHMYIQIQCSTQKLPVKSNNFFVEHGPDLLLLQYFSTARSETV